MADTCIVCLGDLTSTVDVSISHHLGSASDPKLLSNGELSSADANSNTCTSTEVPTETIAHLLPCGHDLHNECLKPWVERANSCPICRQSFNLVQLKARLDGPCVNSYAVQDKRQVAELDPSMIVEDDALEEQPIEPCLLCERYGDEELLLLCDGCWGSCHTYCAGLSSVPAGPWFCQPCIDNPTTQQNPQNGSSIRRVLHRSWRARTRTDQASHAWARVWQSVWDNLNLDLEFPFNEDSDTGRRSENQRREFNEWQQRFRIAERHGVGAAARFRDSAAALLEGRALRSRRTTPHPESQEEISAWNAFDKAREIDSGNSSIIQGRNKRKSAPASPAEPKPEPERRLKRPRTRRPKEPVESPCYRNEQSSSHQDTPSGDPQNNILSFARSAQEDEHGGPSFFHSLLKEVETTPKSIDRTALCLQSPHGPPAMSIDRSSPCSSSPPSSHPSPRLLPSSPPPIRLSRPASPPLTSRIEPIFAHHSRIGNFPADARQSSDSETHRPHGSMSPQAACHPNKPILESSKDFANTSRTETTSRSEIRCMKAEVQQMVASALKPAYKKREIDSEQYTGINRDISRKLYDKLVEAGDLRDIAEREKWRTEAAHQVDAAVKRLKRSNELQVIN